MAQPVRASQSIACRGWVSGDEAPPGHRSRASRASPQTGRIAVCCVISTLNCERSTDFPVHSHSTAPPGSSEPGRGPRMEGGAYPSGPRPPAPGHYAAPAMAPPQAPHGHYHPPAGGPPPGYGAPGGYGPGPGYGYDGPPPYEPGPYRGMGGMPSSMFACVKLRGLPFGVTEAEVGMFLVGAAPCRRAVVGCGGGGDACRGTQAWLSPWCLGLLVACVRLHSRRRAVAWRRAWGGA